MGCQAMDSWTFCGLVGAFLDLFIAYFLLCASTIAFLASKFLGFFGLYLPCPCDGLFGNPNPTRNYCAQQMLLVDYPSEKISTVQLAVKSKFPFDSIFTKDQNYHLNLRLIGENNNRVVGFVEIEDGNAPKSQNMVQRDDLGLGFDQVVLNDVKHERFDVKGKGIVNPRPRSGLRRRRKGGASCKKNSSLECSVADVKGDDALPSPSSANKKEMTKGYLVPVASGANGSYCNEKAPVDANSEEIDSRCFNFDEPLEESKPTEKDASSVKNYESNVLGGTRFDNSSEKTTIRFLEQALEEEHAAQAALYIELEKERSAAASAADEAMAMILRLQEEKALVEMEARQYQRILEEKSVYDAEEMTILKEILVRREREKHFLEKEVEAYRQMIYLGNKQLEGSVLEMEENIQGSGKAVTILEWDDGMNFNKRLSIGIDNVNSDFQEKEIVAMDGSCLPLHEFSVSREHNWFEKTIPLAKKNHNESLTDVSLNCEISPTFGQRDEEKKNKYPLGVEFETETRIHDVHVIRDESKLCNAVDVTETELTYVSDLQSAYPEFKENNNAICESPRTERTVGLPAMGITRCNTLSDLRRNSTSALDIERLKIDNEVWRLRERLRTVQEGRGKLNLSVDNQERKNIELQLLQNIARQLREIRQLTEPGKTVRQPSLPHPSSKVMSKKRRCQSISVRRSS